MGVIYQMSNTNIGRTAALVYQVLRELSTGSGSKDRGYVYAGREYLASVCKCSERTIRRAMRELSAAGLIRDVRMGRGLNNRIYLEPAQNVHSRPDKNAHFHNNAKETKPIQAISIYPQKEEPNAPAARMDGHEYDLKPSVRPQEPSTAHVSTPAKGMPTPKRPRNDRAERRRAARAQYAEALRKRLFLGESGRTLAMLDDDGTRSAAAEAAITMLSDGLAANRNIKVAGAYLTAAQYWAMVQWLDLDTLETVMERVNRADNVRNLTGYLYASLYNECAFRRLWGAS